MLSHPVHLDFALGSIHDIASSNSNGIWTKARPRFAV